MSNTSTINMTLDKLYIDRDNLIQDQNRLALALIDNPANVQTQNNLKSIRAEVEAIKENIEMFEAALAASQIKDRNATNLERATKGRELINTTGALCKTRLKLAKQIDEHIAELGNLLAKYTETSDSCVSTVTEFVSVTVERLEDKINASTLTCGFATARTIGADLGAALIKAGVDRAGEGAFNLHLNGSINPNSNCQIAIENANKILERNMAKYIESIEAHETARIEAEAARDRADADLNARIEARIEANAAQLKGK